MNLSNLKWFACMAFMVTSFNINAMDAVENSIRDGETALQRAKRMIIDNPAKTLDGAVLVKYAYEVSQTHQFNFDELGPVGFKEHFPDLISQTDRFLKGKDPYKKFMNLSTTLRKYLKSKEIRIGIHFPNFPKDTSPIYILDPHDFLDMYEEDQYSTLNDHLPKADESQIKSVKKCFTKK